jgi:hypothetical protein
VDLEAKLDEWERFYNFARLHGAHNGQTPYEALRDKLQSVVHRIYECRVHDVHFAVIHLEDSNVVLKCVCDHFGPCRAAENSNMGLG